MMCPRCERPANGRLRRGVCRKCYRREVKIEQGLPVVPDIADRFAASYEEAQSGCWLWLLAPGSDGYGRFGVNGTQVRAHRYSYEMHVGPIPDGLVIDHLCRTPLCVNPAHLEPVTPGENMRRGVAVERAVARARGLKSCKQGHAFTPENTYIDPRGWRSCRTCRRAAAVRFSQRGAAA